VAKITHIVYPGPVRSKTDGDEHYITANQLVWLYGLRPGTYLIYPFGNWGRERPDRDTYSHGRGS
jgi:hypothetical protein